MFLADAPLAAMQTRDARPRQRQLGTAARGRIHAPPPLTVDFRCLPFRNRAGSSLSGYAPFNIDRRATLVRGNPSDASRRLCARRWQPFGRLALEGAAVSNNDLAVIQEIARIAERGKFDLLFVCDGLDYEQGDVPSFMCRFEPTSLISVLSAHTTLLGLGATVSTSFTNPTT
jgi:hypothetical protein